VNPAHILNLARLGFTEENEPGPQVVSIRDASERDLHRYLDAALNAASARDESASDADRIIRELRRRALGPDEYRAITLERVVMVLRTLRHDVVDVGSTSANSLFGEVLRVLELEAK
jgi:hypothetical protein